MSIKPIKIKTGVISVSFKDNKFGKGKWSDSLYYYLCPYDVEVGDIVIVDSPSDGYVTVIVRGVNCVSKKANKRIVSVVDDRGYKEYLENQEKIRFIKAELETKKALFEELAIYKMMANEDKEVADLLNQLNSLNK